MKLYTVLTTEFALGDYFFDVLITDIESLRLYASIHLKEYGYYKMYSKRFPYTIYYDVMDDNIARVIAVLDQRRNPMTIYTQLADR